MYKGNKIEQAIKRLYNKSALDNLLPFVTQSKLPDPSELNIKRALDHLKLAP